jgi:hemolysin activation/secretion protein
MAIKTKIIILLSSLIAFADFSLAAENQRGNRGIDLGVKGVERSSQKSTTTIVLPELNQVLPQGLGLWSQPIVAVTKVELRGNTVLSDDEINRLTDQYVSASMSSRDIQGLREALSKAYLDKGFVNSGVTIPDQDLAGGVLVLQAVEGKLTNILVDQNDRLRSSYVASRIQSRVGLPLNIHSLQEAIQLLQQDEHIDQLAAELVPGKNIGEADLHVTINEASRWQMGLTADNHRSESIGAEQVNFSVGHNNVTGNGDAIDLYVGTSEGNDNYAVNYKLPVSGKGSYIRVFANASDAVVLEEPFDQLNVKSDTKSAGLELGWALINDLNQNLMLSLSMELNESTTELLGRPFSLSAGSIDGVSENTVVSMSFDWASRSEVQVIAFRSTARVGVDVGNVTLFEDNPFGTVEADGEFLTWLNQAQYVRKINETVQFNVRVLSQTAFDPLLSLEKLAIGGVNTVRGYRENFLVRDNGLSVNFELPFNFPVGESSTFQLMPFVDYGRSWDEEDTDTTSNIRNTDDGRYILSAGISLSYRHQNGISVNVTWAKDVSDNFEEGEDPQDRVVEDGLQDSGIHFSVGYVRRF